MSTSSRNDSVQWVTRRSHLQVSKTEVLPVLHKSRSARNPKEQPGPVPHAFPVTEVNISDALAVIRDWLVQNMEKMYRVGAMNAKPGSLETPDVLRTGTARFTLWFEPTGATFALMIPEEAKALPSSAAGTRGELDGDVQGYQGFIPTPQTLHIVGEIDPQPGKS